MKRLPAVLHPALAAPVPVQPQALPRCMLVLNLQILSSLEWCIHRAHLSAPEARQPRLSRARPGALGVPVPDADGGPGSPFAFCAGAPDGCADPPPVIQAGTVALAPLPAMGLPDHCSTVAVGAMISALVDGHIS